jgi:Fe-S-cluster containining protein
MSACGPPTPTPEAGPASLADAVRQCRRSPRFLAELGLLYAEIQPLALQSGARCLGGGGCCKFDLAGYRLYLTTGELAMLADLSPANSTLRRHDPWCRGPAFPAGLREGSASEDRAGSRRRHASAPSAEAPAAPPNATPPMRCPYQQRGRCSAYDRRPLGCRVYFCRPARSDWCGDVYEVFHRKVALLHQRFDLPYLYVELTRGLAEVLAVP